MDKPETGWVCTSMPELYSLTRRELFAAMAMQGLLSCAEFRRECYSIVGQNDGCVDEESVAAHYSVMYADALCTALDAEPPK